MNTAEGAKPGAPVALDEADSLILRQFAQFAARVLKLPMAALCIAGESQQFAIAASWGLSDPIQAAIQRLCTAVARPDITTILLVSSADAPICTAAAAALYGPGRVRLGALYVFDTAARTFSADERQALAQVAALAAAHIVSRTEKIEAREHLRAVNAASPSAIIFVGLDRKITRWNNAACRLLGWTADDTVGKEYALAPADRVAELELVLRRSLEGGETFSGLETQRLTRDGGLLDVSISAAPLRTADGGVSGSVIVMEDLSGTKRLRELDRRRSKILELTAGDAPLAQIFALIVADVEFGIPGGICTILRCKGNTLEHVASGPTLPQLWREAFRLARIGPFLKP